MKKQRLQRDRAAARLDDPAFFLPDMLEPSRNFAGVSDGGREEQQRNSGRQVDHDFLPHHAPFRIPEKVGLVQHNEVQIRQITPVHGIVELVPKYFGRSDNEGGIRVFLSVARQNPDVAGTEAVTKFGVLGVAEGLQRACVPGIGALLLSKPIDGGFGNPGFAGTGGGGDKTVRLVDRLERFDLEPVGFETGFFLILI